MEIAESGAAGTSIGWDRSRHGNLRKSNKPTVKLIAALIKTGERERVLEIVDPWAPVDVVQLLIHLPLKRARTLYEWLSPLPAAGVLEEMDPNLGALLMEEIAINRVRELVDSLGPEKAADLLEKLPEPVIGEVLPRLSHSTEISRRLETQDETARALMSKAFIAVPRDWTVARVIEHLRQDAGEIRTLDQIYVLDAERHILGSLRASDLVLNPRQAVIADIMQRDVITVPEGMDQEDVARIVMVHDLAAVPVIDEAGRMVGQVTQDEIHDVIREEAEEDIKLMSGVAKDARADQPLHRMVRQRIPWLLAGLAGSSLAALVVGSFDDELAEAAVLASFIPIVMSMAGNAGIQASTVTVQALTAGQLWIGDVRRRIGKELLGGLINGVLVAGVLGCLVVAMAQFVEVEAPLRLAVTAGASLTIVVLLAVAIGATVPLVLDHFGIDPAMATGVFITTGNDIMAVLTFFLMATVIYLS